MDLVVMYGHSNDQHKSLNHQANLNTQPSFFLEDQVGLQALKVAQE
jgi:hypothetical protein